MHSSLESILRQVMADVKVLDAPPNSVVSELRKTKKINNDFKDQCFKPRLMKNNVL